MTALDAATRDRLEEKLDAIAARLAFLEDELREQRLRRTRWEELRSDLAPVTADAFGAVVHRLEAIQDDLDVDELMQLLTRAPASS
jgi:hypothetical protein